MRWDDSAGWVNAAAVLAYSTAAPRRQLSRWSTIWSAPRRRDQRLFVQREEGKRPKES